jgi:hypothetical protein
MQQYCKESHADHLWPDRPFRRRGDHEEEQQDEARFERSANQSPRAKHCPERKRSAENRQKEGAPGQEGDIKNDLTQPPMDLELSPEGGVRETLGGQKGSGLQNLLPRAQMPPRVVLCRRQADESRHGHEEQDDRQIVLAETKACSVRRSGRLEMTTHRQTIGRPCRSHCANWKNKAMTQRAGRLCQARAKARAGTPGSTYSCCFSGEPPIAVN